MPGKIVSFSFADIVAPLTSEEFLTRHWGRSFMRLPGCAGRFHDLLTWDELNRILEQHRLQPPRFRLYQDGKPLDTARYLQFLAGGTVPKLNVAGLTECLSQGATLILDQVDELALRVRDLAVDFQRVLHTYSGVNLYASWRTQNGFDLHWDGHDTVILQLCGRKRWTVYEPTRLHPLTKDVEPAPKPTGAPVWEGMVEDGDALYLPRGWWHFAAPVDEPSLHLTFGIDAPSGVQLLSWVVRQMKQHPEVRQSLPEFASEEERMDYVRRLGSLLRASWTDGVMERYLIERDRRAAPRPRLDLPKLP